MPAPDGSGVVSGWETVPVSRRSALVLVGGVPMLARAALATAAPDRTPPSIESVFGMPSRGVIALPARRCVLDTMLVLASSNVTIRGVRDRTVLAIMSAPVLLRLLDCSDVVFEDIAFESGFAATGEFTYGLITAADVCLRRIRFVRCTFSVPYVAINAIHLVLDHRGSADSVHFEDCVILAAGRMGLEVQNHGNDDARYHDIRWVGGRIANTGLRGSVGMGLSLSGFGADCVIDTVFENNLCAAIEGVGISTSVFTARFVHQNRAIDVLSFTGDRPMHGNVIRHCRTSGPANGNVYLRRQRGLRMTGNDLILMGGIFGRDISATIVENDNYRTASTSALFVESTPGGGSSRNFWTSCTFDNGASRTPFATLRFRGPATRDNHVEGARLVRGPGGVDADNLDGASRNTVTMIEHAGHQLTSVLR